MLNKLLLFTLAILLGNSLFSQNILIGPKPSFWKDEKGKHLSFNKEDSLFYTGFLDSVYTGIAYTKVKFHHKKYKSQIRIVNGLINGDLLVYDKKGHLLAKEHQIAGLAQDSSIAWYPNGNLEYIKIFKDAKLNGYYVEFYPNGKIRIEGYNKNDKGVGVWKEYYEDGKLHKECDYKDGEDTVMVTFYSATGHMNEKAQLVNGIWNGIDQEFYITGKLRAEFYNLNDKKNGPYKRWEGAILVEEGQYKNDKKVGIWKIYKDEKTEEVKY